MPVSAILFLLIFLFSFGKSVKPEEILKEMYPSSEIEIIDKILTPDELKKAEELAGMKIDTRFITFYLVKKENRVLAYGYVDIHRVRTKPEAVLYVISPRGKIELVEILAFHEPVEYLPPKDWLGLFREKSINNLRFKKDIPNITGATLSARAVVKHAKKALALWKVLFGGKE